jgi:AcrR family transcriptional regulator
MVMGERMHRICSSQRNTLSCNGDSARYPLKRGGLGRSIINREELLGTEHKSQIVRELSMEWEGTGVKQDKRDRRSLRTRRLVNAAMMELLLEKRYEAITVRDILERAGIGSSTFYAHYFDKDDVQTSLTEQMLEELQPQLAQRTAGRGLIPILELFQHIQEQSGRFQAMVRGHAGERVWEVVQVALSRRIEQTLTEMYADEQALSGPFGMVARYLAGAFLNLVKWWIETEMAYSPEQMDEIFQRLALPGVWATLGRTSE